MGLWDVPLADVIVPNSDIDVVADVYRSGWLSMGPRTGEFEAELAAYTGARHAIAVSSGTAALHLMCLAVGLAPGDEVIVPSMTFVATVNAVAYTGATPVFADIAGITEPWLSASAVRAAITSRTRAVLTMSYGGHPGEVQDLVDLCDEHGLVLLEDSAHALGSRLDDRHLGTFGRAGAFSFFSNKNLAVGEGGAIITDDAELAERLVLLRSHGMTSLSWDRHEGHATSYDVVALGFNYRIDEPRAALATARLQRLDVENAKRRELDAIYRNRLRDANLQCALPAIPRLQSGCHLFCVVLDEDVDREAFRSRLAERRIQTSHHYPPAHRFSIYAGNHAELRLTEEFARRSVTLPMFPHMSESQLGLVIDATIAAST